MKEHVHKVPISIFVAKMHKHKERIENSEYQ